MSYPNIPLGRTEQERRVSSAVNYLLNKSTYFTFNIEGSPDAGQEVVDLEFPIDVTIDALSSDLRLRDQTGVAPTDNVTFVISVGGSPIGLGVIPAGGSEGTLSFTSYTIPAFTRFLITAPDPQDATLADIIISIAVSE